MLSIESKLKAKAAQVAKARAKTAAMEDDLYSLIYDAHHTHGLSMGVISDLTGLSKTRIVDIANGKARRSS